MVVGRTLVVDIRKDLSAAIIYISTMVVSRCGIGELM